MKYNYIFCCFISFFISLRIYFTKMHGGSMLDNLKITPLYNTYKEYGGKIVEFAGWAMPVQYEGIISEHEAVRKLLDFSMYHTWEK